MKSLDEEVNLAVANLENLVELFEGLMPAYKALIEVVQKQRYVDDADLATVVVNITSLELALLTVKRTWFNARGATLKEQEGAVIQTMHVGH